MRVVPDPIRGAPHLLIMCEVLSPDGNPHPTNTRAPLAALIDDKVIQEAPLFGFEQEYTMLNKNAQTLLGWPVGGFPHPQVGAIGVAWAVLLHDLLQAGLCHAVSCCCGLCQGSRGMQYCSTGLESAAMQSAAWS